MADVWEEGHHQKPMKPLGLNHFETPNLIGPMLKPFLFTTSALILLRPIAFKIGLTDKPCSRKQHEGEIPLIGGLAIYLCVAYIILTQSIDVPQGIAFLAAASIITMTGLIDDFKNLNFKTRFAAEIVAALIMINWGGNKITSLGDLFGFGEIQLGMFSTAFTVFAIVGGINAFNMIDGIDGLAGSISFIVYLLLSALTIFNHDVNPLLFIFALATAAFLLFNFPLPGRKKAWAFLGDTGSMLFGFSICWFVISASQGDHKLISPVVALWLIGAPILDTVCIMIRRMRKGRSPFAPDREHFHHILPVAGYGKQSTLFIILMFATALAMTGIAGNVFLNTPDWVMFYLFIILFAVYYWGMSHSWKMVKIARYLRGRHHERRSKKDRRSTTLSHLPFADRRHSVERRSGKDRRYQATAKDLELFINQTSRPAVTEPLRSIGFHLRRILLQTFRQGI